MGIFDNLKNFIAPTEPDDEEYELTSEEKAKTTSYEAPTTKGVSKMTNDTKMVLFEVRLFEEAAEIANHLKSKRAAVVNIHKLDRDNKLRTLDFLNGVIYALDGSIQTIGENVVLCSPKTIQVEGQINLSNNDD